MSCTWTLLVSKHLNVKTFEWTLYVNQNEFMTLPEIQEELTGTMAASRTLCITCCHGLNWSSLLQLVFQHQACHSPSFFMTISMCGIGLPINLYTRIQIGETVRGILTHTIMLIYKLCWYVSLKNIFDPCM